jgi:C4-type Zn-finger protein
MKQISSLNINCPECDSTLIIKSGTRNIVLKGGVKHPQRMYKCKSCGYQFSENTLIKSAGTLGVPITFTDNQNAILIKRAGKLNLTREQYVLKVLFGKHTKMEDV